jgi:hypothetical protein
LEDDELVGLLTGEINRDLAASMAGCGVAAPKLAVADVASIYRTFNELARRWAALPIGGHLELTFPPSRFQEG